MAMMFYLGIWRSQIQGGVRQVKTTPHFLNSIVWKSDGNQLKGL